MNHGKPMALSGILAALAVVIMCMGGLIPVATYVCPMLCAMVLNMVLSLCGERLAWAWYGVVSILSLLMGPDKEAAAVFLFLGYYPILKPRLDQCKLRVLWKILLFNSAIGALYAVLIKILGVEQIAADFEGFGMGMLAVLLILGNVTFILLDRLLDRWKMVMTRKR